MTRRMCRRIICALKSHPPHSSEELLRERADRHDDRDSIVHVGIRGEREIRATKIEPCMLPTYLPRISGEDRIWGGREATYYYHAGYYPV